MKNKIIVLISMSLLFLACKAKTTEVETKPNIIMFLVDDMGWQDTSVPFWDKKTPLNDRYHTPNYGTIGKSRDEVYTSLRNSCLLAYTY